MEPRKVGRKSKGVDKKTKPVQLSFTETEYEFLSREAAARQHTIPHVIRDLIDKAFYHERPKADLRNSLLILFRGNYRRISRQEAKELLKELADKILYEKGL